MSLDNLNECSACKAHSSLMFWVQFYGSLPDAKATRGPEFLTALLPGPTIAKVEACFVCGILKMVPISKYTEQELQEMAKYKEEQKKVANTGEQFGKLFGGLFQ